MNTTHAHGPRVRGAALNVTTGSRRPHSRNRQWMAADPTSKNGTSVPSHTDGERWERGGGRGGGRGRGRGRGRIFPNQTLINSSAPKMQEAVPMQEYDAHADVEEEMEEARDETNEDSHAPGFGFPEPDEPELETQEDRDRFYQELVKAREAERKKAIAEGKMDDPLVPKRLEDAITMVGTCMDMCPRFERYRRERENNLFEWETVPGTKRVDHRRAVKMYERAAGDKTLPSDLRPPEVLKRTLDYLFHDLLPRGGFSQTYTFIRDRSRAVRNDFTMQHESGPFAIECHNRCARFHILALHFERDHTGFSIALEEQQLMNTLQSLKEFYEEQRGRYESPTELEMRVYHRLVHIRDQRERHEEIPEHITSNPVFKLTTEFRLHVQKKSAPITKTSSLVVDAGGMEIFAKLAGVLREQGNVVMIYLVACLLERLFGKDTIDDIEAIRGDLSISDIIDGKAVYSHDPVEGELDGDLEMYDDGLDGMIQEAEEMEEMPRAPTAMTKHPDAQQVASVFGQLSSGPSSFFGSSSQPGLPDSAGASAFPSLHSSSSAFGTTNVFGGRTFQTSSAPKPTSAFGTGAFTLASKPPGPAAPIQTSIPPRPTLHSLADAPPLEDSIPSTSQPELKPLVNASPNHGSSFQATTTFANAALKQPVALPPASVTSSPFDTSSTLVQLNGAPRTTPTLLSSSGHVSTPPSIPAFKPETSSKVPPPFGPPIHQLDPTAPLFTPSPSGSRASTPSTSATGRTPLAPSVPVNNLPTFSGVTRTEKSSTPSTGRLSATPPLKIDTSFPAPPQPSEPPVQFPPSISSPVAPPPLRRPQPISLPSTPTTGPPNPLLGHLKNNLEASPLISHPGVLSPLDLPSPSSSSLTWVNNFSPRRLPIRAPSQTSTSTDKGKTPEPPTASTSAVVLTREDLNSKARAFAESTIMRRCYLRWKKRVADVATWLAAVEHSDAYRVKLQSQKSQKRRSESAAEKRRRVSVGPLLSDGSPIKKRQRKRLSDYREPKTDEEIARRLKENREENEQRWAQGSYLKVIRAHVHDKLSSSVLKARRPWNIWLSLNPECDSTAIWLERKFSVPDSGQWTSESIFSIPLFQGQDAEVDWNPGLLVFECTPADGVQDDIERKYRVLDDCSRLRDIINALSPKRHYIPSILVLNWVTGEQTEPAPDFVAMVKKYVDDSTIAGFAMLGITTTTNLDMALDAELQKLKLDVEGRLVRSVTVRGVFKIFEEDFSTFLLEWFDNCSANGYFDWYLYAHVVRATIGLLNKMAAFVLAMLSKPKREVLPNFDIHNLCDSDTAYEAALTWLSRTDSNGDSAKISVDLESHINISQNFPARTFIEHLLELTVIRVEKHAGSNPHDQQYIPVIDLKAASELFEAAIQPFQMNLGQVLNMSMRRSPKRRGVSEETEEFSPEVKRLKMVPSSVTSVAETTPPATPYINGRHHSLSPSVLSTAPTETPGPTASTSPSQQVTVAMLRALTRDVKRKYASPKAPSPAS